jgi:light-harvesting protein B-800-850 alpha chain
MNNGRIWCVVKPTVGLPLFLGGVTVIALTVHAAVLSHTNWFGNYWQGSRAARADAAPIPNSNLAQAPNDAGFSVSVTPVPVGTGNGTAFVVTIVPRAGDPAQTVTLVQRAEPPPDGSGGSATTIR